MKTTQNNYKPTVSAVILNSKNEVLLTHNKNHGPDFWKFPQGGVEKEETGEQAIKREMFEELGSKNFTILKKSSAVNRYEWPVDVQKKKAFNGPEIVYYILRSESEESLTPNQEELDGLKWVIPKDLPGYFKTLPEFQTVLNQLLKEIKLISNSG